MDLLIGKLRPIFKENNRTGDREEGLSFGNPAASFLVKNYLKRVKEEQPLAGITPNQIVPLFAENMVCLADYINRKLVTCHDDPLQTYILSRDQAYFKILFFSGDRPGDLAFIRSIVDSF